jgi:hypothetical protein
MTQKGIPVRFNKGDIFKFGRNFYIINEVERVPQMTFDNDSTAFTASTAATFEVDELEPNKNRLTHIETIGVNGYIEIQLHYPQSTVRGSIKGVTERFNWWNAPFQNPMRWIFFIPENFPPYLNINNPMTYNVNAEVYFTGYRYDIKNLGQARPIDPETGQPIDFFNIDNYVPGIAIMA